MLEWMLITMNALTIYFLTVSNAGCRGLYQRVDRGRVEPSFLVS